MSVFFFFKQKTAYEMRISDWSSDVCSSDLGKGGEKTRDEQRPAPPDREAGFRRALGHREADRDEAREAAEGGGGGRHQEDEETDRVEEAGEHRGDSGDEIIRSEEHTSELQSLMRISYAVFCLKKKTKKTHIQ